MSDFAASLDEQLLTVQPWCTCREPYWCKGLELTTEVKAETEEEAIK
jgi:hypothetical protein